MLNDYITQTQYLLNDINGTFFSTGQLQTWINIARNRVAAEAECIRVLTAGGQVTSITITSGGSGHATAPTLTIAAPVSLGGVQATATCTVSGGAINAVTITNPGLGYLSAPAVTLSSGTGALTAAVSPATSTVAGQESYPFSTFNTAIAALNPAVSQIMAVQSLAISWGTTKPTLQRLDFTAFQAYCRSYSQNINTYPLIWCQYQQGAAGSVRVWPYPNQPQIMELDCYCLPIPLTTDSDPEAIPYPWTDTVPFYAAYYAYLRAQNPDMAKVMMSEVRRTLPENRSFAEASRIPDMYGGDW